MLLFDHCGSDTDYHLSVFVAYPRIAQGGINDSTLEITQMKITDPKPDSVQLDLTQVIGTHGSLHPTIYGFNASVSLAGSSSPFSSVYVPDVQPEGETVVNISRRMQWSNETAFAEYVKAVWFNEQVQLNVYGTPELKEGGLPTIPVVYNKTVTMKGMPSGKLVFYVSFCVELTNTETLRPQLFEGVRISPISMSCFLSNRTAPMRKAL